jgi:hypothetical protein
MRGGERFLWSRIEGLIIREPEAEVLESLPAPAVYNGE